MPIEIRELIIKATVASGGGAAAGAAGQNANSGNNGVSPAEELITTCVDRILEILKEKNER
jgi:hypothetical protein